MNRRSKILLPGLDKQYTFLQSRLTLSEMKILILGTETETIAKKLFSENNLVEVIVENYDALINYKLKISDESGIQPKLMDFERTDYDNESFDLIFAQASISDFRRNKIVKEIKRILKPSGYFCVGEVIRFEEELPSFMKDLFDQSDLDPLLSSGLHDYYKSRNWEIIDSTDLSSTLKTYYQEISDVLEKNVDKLSQQEKSYYKKMLNQIRHESNAYIKLGGNKYMGFMSLLFKEKIIIS